jgi:predicted permease
VSWRRFFKREQWDAERRREIDAYIDIETDHNIARGMTAHEAREAAQRKFGNRTLVQEEIYRMNTLTFIDSLARDLRYALRGMHHSPSFTAVAVLTLALGIGATTAIFSVVNGVLLKPLPYPDPDLLVGVWQSAVMQGRRVNNASLAPPMYFTYFDQNQTFEAFGAWSPGAANVTGMGDPEEVRTVVVTQGVLPALGVQPFLGRWFSSADDTPGTPETVVLSYGYWQRRFGGDRGVIGGSLVVSSRPREVIGVMPASFRFPDADPEMFLPQRFERAATTPNFSFRGIARLKRGVTLAQANADVARMLPAAQEAVQIPPEAMAALRMGPALRPLKQDVVGDIGKVLWVLMGSVGLVLLIACANVANLLLVRGEARRQELAVRAALGAGWGRIARELLVESAGLASIGGVLGVGLAYGGLRLLVFLGPANLPRLAEIAIDPLALAFAAGVSLLSGLAFGLIPVFKHAGPRIAGALRGNSRTASLSRERHRARNTLVVGQVALALVLLVSSGLMIRSFQALRNVQPGFTQPEQVQTVRISIAAAQVAEPARVTRMQTDIVDKIAAIPGVVSVAFSTGLPMETEYRINNFITMEDRPVLPEGQFPPMRRYKYVSPGLFQTLGTRFIAGRDFTWTDIHEKREVVVISENLARELWGRPDTALGKRIGVGMADGWSEIVGVVGDVYDEGVHQSAPATVYWPARESSRDGFVVRAVTVAIRSTRTGTESFLNQIREAVWSVNPSLPLAQVRTLGEVYTTSMVQTSFTLVMLAIAGAMALLLGVVGIYGVISYAVSQRRREIGIRLALGAQPRELRGMFVRQALALAAIGSAIGLLTAAGLTRLMASMLFEVSPLDPATFAAVAAILLAAAVLASYAPARRAGAVDPLDALRAD